MDNTLKAEVEAVVLDALQADIVTARNTGGITKSESRKLVSTAVQAHKDALISMGRTIRDDYAWAYALLDG
jgi:hypothetical protein